MHTLHVAQASFGCRKSFTDGQPPAGSCGGLLKNSCCVWLMFDCINLPLKTPMMHVSVDILVAFSSTWRQCITEASVPDAKKPLLRWKLSISLAGELRPWPLSPGNWKQHWRRLPRLGVSTGTLSISRSRNKLCITAVEETLDNECPDGDAALPSCWPSSLAQALGGLVPWPFWFVPFENLHAINISTQSISMITRCFQRCRRPPEFRQREKKIGWFHVLQHESFVMASFEPGQNVLCSLWALQMPKVDFLNTWKTALCFNSTYGQLDHGCAPTKPAITHICYQHPPRIVCFQVIWSCSIQPWRRTWPAPCLYSAFVDVMTSSEKQLANLNRCWGGLMYCTPLWQRL